MMKIIIHTTQKKEASPYRQFNALLRGIEVRLIIVIIDSLERHSIYWSRNLCSSSFRCYCILALNKHNYGKNQNYLQIFYYVYLSRLRGYWILWLKSTKKILKSSKFNIIKIFFIYAISFLISGFNLE